MSVNRTVYGSRSGNLSVSPMAMSSRLSQSNFCGIPSSLEKSRTIFLVVQLLRVVLVPLGDFDHDVSCTVGNSLATEARLRRNSRSFIELIQFRVGGFIAGLEALLHHDVAGRAGADSAAGMIEAGLQRFGKIQNTSGRAVVGVRNLRRIHFQRFAAGQKRHLKLLGRRLVPDLFDVSST